MVHGDHNKKAAKIQRDEGGHDKLKLSGLLRKYYIIAVPLSGSTWRYDLNGRPHSLLPSAPPLSMPGPLLESECDAYQ